MDSCPDKDLVTAVKIARLVNKPLLIRGEPGSGKTRLAQAIAFELHGKDYRKNYFEWHIKSTSKAKEGLYQFDHLKRLRDLEMAKLKGMHDKDYAFDGLNPKKYRTYGALGKAFISSTDKDRPSILLIDEIDKADIDFPNDLLLELDQRRFEIPETEEDVVAKVPPIIIIASNDEKELPKAFLRRCVFYYIQFPKLDALQNIARERLRAEIMGIKDEKTYELSQEEKDFIDKAAEHFHVKYKEMDRNPNIDKVPSTRELLDWVEAIYFNDKQPLIDILNDEAALRPFYNTLIKSYNDQVLILGQKEL